MLKRNQLVLVAFIFVFVAGIGLFFLSNYKPSADTTTGSAMVSIAPSSATKTVGDELQIQVNLTTDKEVTVIGVDLNYSTNLTYESFDSTGSVFSASVTDPAPASNHFKIERARFDTGYKGTSGLIGTLKFKTNAAGTGTITINQSTTQVLDATTQQNLLGSVQNGSYTINTASVTPPPNNPTTTDTGSGNATPTTDSSSDSGSPASASVTDTSGSNDNTTSTDSTSKKNTSIKTTTPKTTTKTTTPAKTVTKTSPSVANSSVVTDKTCSVAGSTDYFTLTVSIKDDSNNPLTDDDYKPKVSVAPKDGITGAITKQTNGQWTVKIRSASAQQVVAKIGSLDKLLATVNLNFATTCDSSAAATTTNDTTTPAATVTTPTTTKVAATKKSNILYYLIGAVVLAVAAGGAALFLRKPKVTQEASVIEPPAVEETPPTQTPPTV